MKRRAYRSEIAKKAIEVTAAGGLGFGPRYVFTPERLSHMKADQIGGGEFDIKYDAFYFGKIVVDRNDFKQLMNHYKTHVDSVPNPETDILKYIAQGALSLTNSDTDEYRILWENYMYMSMPHRTIDEIRKKSFENANLGVARFKFNMNSEMAKVFRNESYTSRPTTSSSSAKKKTGKKAVKKKAVKKKTVKKKIKKRISQKRK